ncbi:hypothetical protein [Caldanaerobacter sp.]|uniref:hypothetical protein n=1 Tax=Caldanaerobacter sp. TaxID=2930036 RepID=UPI003C7254DB
MAILKIILDRKTMQEIRREIIPSDVEPNYDLLARILGEQFLRDMKRGKELQSHEHELGT